MKHESDLLDKSLENLENDFWKESEYSSYLILTCHQLRKKNLKDFEVEDLRIMIGQNIGLKFLIPLAVKVLQENILSEGDFYEGDLLNSVLSSETKYWNIDVENWKKVCNLFTENVTMLKEFDTTKSIKSRWFDLYEKFKIIN